MIFASPEDGMVFGDNVKMTMFLSQSIIEPPYTVMSISCMSFVLSMQARPCHAEPTECFRLYTHAWEFCDLGPSNFFRLAPIIAVGVIFVIIWQ